MTIDPSDSVDLTNAASDNGLGDRGGVRGDAYPVEVVVKSGGDPVKGVAVTFTATTSVTATTDDNGVASISLEAGEYEVSASTDAGSATETIEVVASTDPLIVELSLDPPTQ